MKFCNNVQIQDSVEPRNLMFQRQTRTPVESVVGRTDPLLHKDSPLLVFACNHIMRTLARVYTGFCLGRDGVTE